MNTFYVVRYINLKYGILNSKLIEANNPAKAKEIFNNTYGTESVQIVSIESEKQ